MSEPRTRDALEQFDRFVAIVVSISLFVLVVIYFLLAIAPRANPPDFGTRFADFSMNIIANTIPMALVSVISYVTIRGIQKLRSAEDLRIMSQSVERVVRDSCQNIFAGLPQSGSARDVIYYANFNSLPWEQYFRVSSNVDIFVHYFDSWLNQHEQTVLALFNNGGRLQVVLPDPDNNDLLAVIKLRFQNIDPDFASYNEQTIAQKIRSTEQRFRSILNRSTHVNAQLIIYFANDFILYCGAKFDNRWLFMSPFEHIREASVQAPAFVVELNMNESAASWFDKEFSGIIQRESTKREIHRPHRPRGSGGRRRRGRGP